MSKDLVGVLNDRWDWWTNATEATKWKQKFECMKEIFQILKGCEEVNVELDCRILDHKRAGDLLNILITWLESEQHVFTRIAILRLMPVLIEGFSKKTLIEYQGRLIATIMTQQWTEKKRALLDLATPTLIQLWLKVCFLFNKHSKINILHCTTYYRLDLN